MNTLLHNSFLIIISLVHTFVPDLKLTNSYLFNELKLKGSLIPIGVVCLLAYIAKLAYGSVIGGATDDFILISEGLNFDYSFYVSQGRWAVAFISTLLAPLELDYIGGKNLFGIIYAIQIAFSMLILIRFLIVEQVNILK